MRLAHDTAWGEWRLDLASKSYIRYGICRRCKDGRRQTIPEDLLAKCHVIMDARAAVDLALTECEAAGGVYYGRSKCACGDEFPQGNGETACYQCRQKENGR